MSDGSQTSTDAQLARFVRAFRRGIEDEIAAMRERFGAAELSLDDGVEVGDGIYQFAFVGSPGRLTGGDECALRTPSGELPVAIVSVDGGRVCLRAPGPLDPADGPLVLVSAPWFLHRRLIEALAQLDASRHAVHRGLALFGKGETRRAPCAMRLSHRELNASQRAAVGLTLESDLSFVWGPPGTGKTTTLAHIVLELVAGGDRVLVASTTNAALDQALAKLVANDALPDSPGAIVRLGASDAETFGCQIDELAARLHRDSERSLRRLEERSLDVGQLVERARHLAARLAAASEPQQSLFSEPAFGVADWELQGLVPPAMVPAVAALAPAPLARLLDRRLRRFERLAALLRERLRAVRRALREGARAIVENASVVLATLAHVYLSPALAEGAFDAVVIDEASMATLPTLFYAACLGHRKTIVVGDPRQLPPIVAAESRFAEQVLGRNIFDVTVPDPDTADIVALLDTQYRMVPEIGDLVGELFYGGRLEHGGVAARHVTAAEPFAGAPLIVVDTGSETRCDRGPRGRSRANSGSAAICVDLARRASGAERTIAVITPYTAQARAIRRDLDAAGLDDVECSTIHRFQGQERDVVIIDLVDTGDMAPSLLLGERGRGSKAACLLNVSISRAAGKLILVADVGYFSSRLPDSVATGVLAAAIRRGIVRRAPVGS